MESILEQGCKIGTGPNDIKGIYTHVTENNEFDTFYVEFNNGRIEKINKPLKKKQEEFLPEFKKFLLQVGATDNNRDSSWYLISDSDPNIKILQDKEETYKLQRKQIADMNYRRYRAKKVRVVEKVLKNEELDVKPLVINAISTGVFALTYFAQNNHDSLLSKLTFYAGVASALLLSISMNKIRKLVKDAWQEEYDREQIELFQQSSAIGIEQKNQNAIEDKHAKK